MTRPTLTQITRPTVLLITAICALLSLAWASDARADAKLQVTPHRAPAWFAPSDMGQHYFKVRNVGDQPTSEPIAITVELPTGMTTMLNPLMGGAAVTNPIVQGGTLPADERWTCPLGVLPGQTQVSCTRTKPLQPGRVAPGLVVFSQVPAEPVAGPAAATVTGGAPGADPVVASIETPVSSNPVPFDMVEGSLLADVFDVDEQPVRTASSHPFAGVVSFDINQKSARVNGAIPTQTMAGTVRDVDVDLPPGFYGNPQAADRCTAGELADLRGLFAANCPVESQVGIIEVGGMAGILQPSGMIEFEAPVYNMVPPRGTVAAFAFVVQGNPVYIYANLDPADYSVKTVVTSLNEAIPVRDQRLTLWGVPTDPANDVQRFDPETYRSYVPPGGGLPNVFEQFQAALGASSGWPTSSFLTLPSECGVERSTTVRVGSWQYPGDPTDPVDSDPVALTGCDDPRLRMDADVNAKPTITKADSPTGLDIEMKFAQKDELVDDPTDLYAESGEDVAIASSPLRTAKITFPEGMSITGGSADGLVACSDEDLRLGTSIGLGVDDPRCPNASRIGDATVSSPVLEEQLSGGIYLRPQLSKDPGSGQMFRLALILRSNERGVIVKLPGEVKADPQSGQIEALFEDNPQLPVESLQVKLKGGPRAPLATPPACGIYEIETELTPWSGADPTIETSSFKIDRGPDGGACIAGDPNQPADPADLGERPFEPNLSAGLRNPVADSYSPFVVNLDRPDGHQELSSLSVALPEGVTAKLAGVDYCPDGTLKAIEEADDGAGESSSPSCPANSQIGVATVGAGAGTNPIYVQTGKAYLSGPYKGAQLSLAVVVPALAGPFDLGTEVVRSKLNVDPRTAQVSVVSDPLPQILHGVPLRIRDLRVNVNRDGFMKAGTSCEPMQIGAEIQGSHGKSASLTNRFQVGDCASLGFNPKLNLSFGSKRKDTRAGSHPPLNAKLRFNEGDANISSVEVALPQGLFLDQDRLGRICSRASYAAETCPEESVVGYAKATTPLLDEPVEGPVYLKASDNPLPDLAADLNGQIDVDLFGKIDQKQNKKGLNQIRNTFDIVPDVPVSAFELTLEGGDEGLLVNSRNICKSKKAQKVSIDIAAHNEMTSSSKPLIGSACKSINKKRAKKLKVKAKKLLKKAKKADDRSKAKQLRKQARKLKRQARKLGR